MTKFALDRPVTVLMLFLGVVLMGFLSWQKLSLELLPSLSYPQITVLTSYENVAPPEIESLVSKPIEEAVGTVQGVRKISSLSKEGISLVTVDFDWGRDIDLSALDVREKIDAVRDVLPKEVSTPVVVKFDPASFPILTLGISGPGSLQDLARIASQEIKQKLERIPGVALARISGAVEREILISVDPGRLFAYGIPISAVVEKLKEANFNFPGGSIEKGNSDIRIRTLGQFESLNEIEKTVVARNKSKTPIFLRDVATVVDSFKDRTSSFVINREKSIGISVFKQADSNTVRVSEEIIETVAKLRKDLGSKISISVVYNQATFIKDAIQDLEFSGLIGGLLAFGVLFFFLGSFRSALVITTAIPISVLGTFGLMYATGISLNIMSLGGLALGVGMLVDNGIVVLENIHRHKEKSKDDYQTTLGGAREMQKPILASTFAHIVVFLPIMFVKGLAGKFFVQLALTISFSLLVSILVALALNPMLEAGRLFSRQRHRGSEEQVRPPELSSLNSSPSRNRLGSGSTVVQRGAAKMMRVLGNGYARVLSSALENRKGVLLASFLALGASIFLATFLGSEFIPRVDQGSFVMQVTTPAGSTLEATESVAARIYEILSAQPEVKDVFVSIGYDRKEKTEKALGELRQNIAKMTVVLKDRRSRPLEDIVGGVRPDIAKIAGAQVEYILNQDVTQLLRQKEKATEILEIRGPDLERISALAGKVTEKLQKVECLKDVQSSLGSEDPEIQLIVDREKAAQFKLTVKDIAETVKIAMEGKAATTYRDGDQDVDIMVRLRNEDRKSLHNLENVFLNTPLGGLILLKEVATLKQEARLTQIERRDLGRVSVISGNITGAAFSECLDGVRRAVAEVSLPPEHSITIGEQQEELSESTQSLVIALVLSIVLVYMLLASLFESFLYPLIIMVAVPLAGVGVVVLLLLTGSTVSLGVYIGAIMLGGIVVNSSIILVDYINRLRSRGYSSTEAVLEAGKARLRPIVMTTLTTILGLIPLAIGLGRGAEIRVPLALTVIGGLVTSTAMTLVIIPVIYSLIEDLRLKTGRRKK